MVLWVVGLRGRAGVSRVVFPRVCLCLRARAIRLRVPVILVMRVLVRPDGFLRRLLRRSSAARNAVEGVGARLARSDRGRDCG